MRPQKRQPTCARMVSRWRRKALKKSRGQGRSCIVDGEQIRFPQACPSGLSDTFIKARPEAKPVVDMIRANQARGSR